MINVMPPQEEIPKNLLLEQCEKEAPAFLWTLLHFELPETTGRLRIPVVETEEKQEQMEANRDQLTIFIDEEIYIINGHKVLLAEFFNRFQLWLPPDERPLWTNRRVSKLLPFPKGKADGTGQIYVGNVSFENHLQPLPRYKREKGRLIHERLT